MPAHARFKVTALIAVIMLTFPAMAHALSGTYVVLTKGGGGLAVFFSQKGTFTSVALHSRNGHKHHGKGKYSVSGNVLTLTTSNGVTGNITIQPNGDLYDQAVNLRLHRYKGHVASR